MRTMLALLVLALPAAADEVHLKNGNRLKGVVREEGNRVIVSTDLGTVTIDRAQVDRIIRSKSPLEEFADRFRSIKLGDADGYHALGVWAKENDLPTKAREAFERAIGIQPDHEAARKQLGYRLHEGRWMTEEEHMVALGFVRYQGDWLKRETVEKLREQEEQLRRERENLATMQKIAELEAEIERMRISAELERDRLMIEAVKTQPVFRLYSPGTLHYHAFGTVTYPCWCDWRKKKK